MLHRGRRPHARLFYAGELQDPQKPGQERTEIRRLRLERPQLPQYRPQGQGHAQRRPGNFNARHNGGGNASQAEEGDQGVPLLGGD